ncbi:MAG: metal-dependent hydrolase [Verrucomicrobiales bacterium]|nr:metal-dependent hydrolase [Verrucomicrobiales bacterium]
MLELAVLGSGSSGNSALVRLGETTVLIDAGLSARQLCVRMQSLGVEPDDLTAIVLTHEHGDHTCGIDVFCRKREIPIYATTHTCAIVREQVKSKVKWHHFEAGADFRINDIHIESFSVPHDAVDPVGFVFRCDHSRLGVLSDVGHVTRLIVDRLQGVDTLFTEANYDEVMLQNDTHRPWSTKQRISNRHGHLSNDQTADLVSQIASERLTRVVLGHLSSDCNTSDLATSVISRKLEELGHHGIDVVCAQRKDPLPLRPVAKKPPEAPAAKSDTPEQPTSYVEEKAAKSARVCEPSAAETRPAAKPRSNDSDEWSQMEWAF